MSALEVQTQPQGPFASDIAEGSASAARSRTLLMVSGIVTLVALAIAGTVGFVLNQQQAMLVDDPENSALTGGSFVVTGVARNTGTGPAPNATVQISLGSGHSAVWTAAVGEIAPGSSRPYSISIPADELSGQASPRFATVAKWDQPALEATDIYVVGRISGGHVMAVTNGNVRNNGKGLASNTRIDSQFAADKEFNSLLGSTTVKVGDLPAGATVPFSLEVDIGSNPPHDVYYSHQPSYDAARLVSEQEAARRVGGIVVLSGHLRNSGSIPAESIALTDTLLDVNGKPVASGNARLAALGPGKSGRYQIWIDLGNASPDDVQSSRLSLAWHQTRFLLLHESKGRTVSRLGTPVSSQAASSGSRP